LTYIRLRRASAYFALPAAAVLSGITGCQQQTIVARVNGKPVTESDFMTSVQKVKQASFQGQQDPKMDAGAITLVNSIQSLLVDQCASEPSLKATPSEETVKAYFNQVEHKYPNIKNSINSHDLEQQDVLNQIKTTLEMQAIGTDGAKPDDKELKDVYDKHIADHTLEFPTQYTIRFVMAPNKEQAVSALEALKKTGDFKKAAADIGIPAQQAATMIRPTIYSGEQLPKEVTKVLDTLTPNNYTSEPIEFTIPGNPNNPQAATPTTRFMLAQLIEKVPGSTPKMADVRELLGQMALQEKYPQWSMHATVRVAEFTEKSAANIEILIDRYKYLRDEVILPAAKRNAGLATGGGVGLPSGGIPSGASGQ
jgi:hypothetical protein